MANNSVSIRSVPAVDKRIAFSVQIAAVLIIVLFCLLNLTVPYLENQRLEKYWVGLLGSSIGYLVPNPKLKAS
jgi:hypothetical protein